MAKKKLENTVKCPGCHAYFVEEGKVCSNCEVRSDESTDSSESESE